jgi:hypothetical protein
MQNRRDVIALGASAAAAGLAGIASAAAPGASRLETRLFNFKDSVSPDEAARAVEAFKRRAEAAAVDGLLVGRNYIPEQFKTRYEWIYMIQFDGFDARANDPRLADLTRAREALSALCRNEAQGDLTRPLPPRFGSAPGVKVRHVVMFSFKPDASDEARVRNVEAIREMGKLPMVQNYVVERCDPSVVGENQMQWQVIGDFASPADYMAYATAPVHVAIREDFTAHTSRVAFLDVMVG